MSDISTQDPKQLKGLAAVLSLSSCLTLWTSVWTKPTLISTFVWCWASMSEVVIALWWWWHNGIWSSEGQAINPVLLYWWTPQL